MTSKQLGAYLARTEPHLRTVQLISDRYRKPVSERVWCVCLGIAGPLVIIGLIMGLVGAIESGRMATGL